MKQTTGKNIGYMVIWDREMHYREKKAFDDHVTSGHWAGKTVNQKKSFILVSWKEISEQPDVLAMLAMMMMMIPLIRSEQRKIQ